MFDAIIIGQIAQCGTTSRNGMSQFVAAGMYYDVLRGKYPHTT